MLLLHVPSLIAFFPSLPQPRVGDYVISHAGFAIERLSAEQALESIAAAREVEAALAEGRNAR